MKQTRRAKPSSGFSLLEMMIVVSIVTIITGYAVISAQGGIRDARVNGAMDTAYEQLRVARARAIAERRRYVVTFGTPAPALATTPLGAPTAKSIQLYSWPWGFGMNQVATTELPSDVAFQALSGLPTSPSTVPDGFGSGSTAIDFDQGVGAGATNAVMFMPDGSAHDLTNNFNSGILYIARNGDVGSSRAITVFGTSGRVRAWHLRQPGGGYVWKQQ